MTTKLPADYTVLLDLTTIADGSTSTLRLGGYHSLDDAKSAIASNEADCRKHNINTHKRAYRTFHAVWTEVGETENGKQRVYADIVPGLKAADRRDQIEPYLKRWVLRFRERDDSDGSYVDHRTEFTENRCAEIAKMNGDITTAQAHKALVDGRRIYTNFSYFVLEA